MEKSAYFTSKEVLKYLGIKPQTLYAYVSRGWIRSIKRAKDRERLYVKADVESVKARSQAKKGHGAVAASALRWGEPVLDSAITDIRAEGCWYRGISTLQLVKDRVRYEQVAELLWSGTLPEKEPHWESPAYLDAAARTTRPSTSGAAVPVLPADEFNLFLATARLNDPLRDDHRVDTVLAKGRGLIKHFASFFHRGPQPSPREQASWSVARLLARGLCPQDSDVVEESVNTFLILAADNELASSSFAARIASSVRSDFYACLQAAIVTYIGPQHGRGSQEVERFIDQLDPGRKKMEAQLAERLARGLAIPGFRNPPIYAAGDPRVPVLLEITGPGDKSALSRKIRQLGELMEKRSSAKPDLDFASVAVAAALGTRRGLGCELFAVGRMAGWIAHILEQRLSGYTLRPRARYIGR